MPAHQEEKPVSDAENQRRLRDMSDEELAKLPQPPHLKDAVVMEEDDPERFKKLMSEGSGDSRRELVGRSIGQLSGLMAGWSDCP